MDAKWIQQHTTFEPSYFYLLAKIHKTPLKTRPIIPYSGSVCYDLAKWLDVELKKLLPHLPYITSSSFTVATELKQQTFPSSTQFFTMDATAMYTNIHLSHALPVLTQFLKTTELGKLCVEKSKINPNVIITVLEIVMQNNIFAFGDTFWQQTAGTAMGTPPAPTWATIYFCIWELIIIPEFNELIFNTRYIKDSLGAWVPNLTRNNTARLAAFQHCVQSFGINHPFFHANPELQPLQWTFSDLASTTVFLDLKLALINGRVTTTIYEKELNLYLYIPPHSCHSPGVIKGIIFGMVHCAKNLCTFDTDRLAFLVRCYKRLLNRGYSSTTIKPIFCTAIRKLLDQQPTVHHASTPTETNSQRLSRPLFLHAPVNPANPSLSRIQQLFKRHLHTDTEHGDFSHTCNNLIVCYHGQPSLRNILAPRKGHFGDGFSISDAFSALELN